MSKKQEACRRQMAASMHRAPCT